MSSDNTNPKETMKLKFKKERLSNVEPKRVRDTQKGKVVKEFEYDIGNKMDVKKHKSIKKQISDEEIEKSNEKSAENDDKLVKTVKIDSLSSDDTEEKTEIDDKRQELQKEVSLQVAKEVDKAIDTGKVKPHVPMKKKKRRLKIKKIQVDSLENEDISVLDLPVIKPLMNEGREIKSKDRMKKRTSVVPKTVQLSKLNEEFYNERKWPDGEVIYVIKNIEQYDLDDLRSRLAEVNNILLRRTCVKLREVTEDQAEGFEDFIILDNSPDYVTGMVGGKQIFGCVELFQGSQHRQHTAMMVMAMLGFYFEVSRHDRDKFIRVHNRHIRPDKLHHFEKIRDEATLDLPYDYKSATHPAWQFWRKIGRTGISTVATYKENDPDGSIMRSLGQNSQLLSEIDIVKINSIYGVQCFESEDNANQRAKP